MADITKADVLVIAPELTSISDGTWTALIADAYSEMNAAAWGTEARRNRAAKYLVAHLATMTLAEGDSTNGAIQSESVGQVSVTYATGSGGSSAGSLEATSYGQEYLRLLRLRGFGLAVT